MNKRVKKLIAKVVLGATMALTVTGAGLISSNVQASASTGVYDSKYIEDHNQIQVQSWYYNNNCYNYKFKYAREDTGFIDLCYCVECSATHPRIYLAQEFPNVIYNGARSQTNGSYSLTRDTDGFLILTIDEIKIESCSVNAKFYADDGNNYFYRNTNASPSLYEGDGFTIQG